MTRHCFVSSAGRAPPRWRETFPEAGEYGRTDHAAAADADLLWILDDPGERDNTLEIMLAHKGKVLILLSMEPTDADALAFYKAGAKAYCHALAAGGLLRQVVSVVSQGGYWLGENFMAVLVGTTDKALNLGLSEPESELAMPEQLTPRERAVARAVARGATNREVAEELNITVRTVKAHLTAVFEKLGIRDRLQLTVMLNRSPMKVGRAS